MASASRKKERKVAFMDAGYADEPQNNGHDHRLPELPRELRTVMHWLREDWHGDRFHAIAAATYRLQREGGYVHRDHIAVWADARGMNEEFITEAMAYGIKQWDEHNRDHCLVCLECPATERAPKPGQPGQPGQRT
jgi:hypothetical protein